MIPSSLSRLSSAVHREVIEDYPTDQPVASSPIYGDSQSGDPIVWAWSPENRWAVLITKSDSPPVLVQEMP
jgi:hypothetical protein